MRRDSLHSQIINWLRGVNQSREGCSFRKMAKVLVLIGFGLIFYFGLSQPFNDGSGIPNAALFAKYGAFIGGLVGVVFSFVAIILLYETLRTQQQAIKNQQDAFRKELFEKTFFNLLGNQHDITEGIKAYFYYLKDDLSPDPRVVTGREFFLYAAGELDKIWKTIENEKYLGYDDNEYLTAFEMAHEELFDKNSVNYTSDCDAQAEIKRISTEKKHCHANHQYKIDKSKWEKIKKNELQDKISTIFGLFFQNYHYAIGHYFRNLYQIIKFANEFEPSTNLDDTIASKYIGFIQAQMSTYEQLLLFYYTFKFPDALSLIKQHSFFENLTEEDLIDVSHNCRDGVKLKSTKNN
jgi:hypothetical protein